MLIVPSDSGSPASLSTTTAVLVVNFNTSALTLRCVRSVLAAGAPKLFVLDNGSRPEERDRLIAGLQAHGKRVEVVLSEVNLGFAQGCNALFERALADDNGFRHLLVINSDAALVEGAWSRLLAAACGSGAAMVGGRVDHFPEQTTDSRSGIESMGVTLYRSLLASNRKHGTDVYLGPTGACALYARELLLELKARHGYIYDPEYFCYSEDIDLCMRARLLGFRAVCVSERVAFHVGQASSGGPHSDFVLFHGVRNALWTTVKCTPLATLLKHTPWIVLLHGGIVLRHVLRGKTGVLWRLYLSAARGMPAMLRKRRLIQRGRRISTRQFEDFVTPSFYEPEHVRNALSEAVSLRKRGSP